MPAPEVYAFVEYRQYLEAWFEWKKSQNPRFSHRAAARRVGESSPSFLADVIRGRRNLTTIRRDAVADLCELDAEARGHFALLVALDQAADVQERKRVWEKIAGTRRFREARQVEGDSWAYLSTWYYPAIRELVRRPDFREDPRWIADLLRPRISPEEAAEALRVLWALGMLVRDGSRVVQAEGSIATPRQVQGLAAHAYHTGMLERAQASIGSFRSVERHHVGVTVAIPASLVPALKREIDLFASQLLDLCESAGVPGERAYQIQLALFPLSAGEEET